MESGQSDIEVREVPQAGETGGAGPCVIEIRNLKKSFGDSVLGRSGAGKSVLIKCIVGLLEPDAGTISLFGKDTATVEGRELAELRRKIGFLFQSAALYDSMSVRENLEFALRSVRPRPSRADTDERVRGALKAVGLSASIGKMPSELSGGMRKRLGLARTLIQQPEIMLYDEPTTGLDPITAREISTLILEVQKSNQTTSIIITHDMECTKITSNRIVVLDGGLCVAEGTFEQLEESQDEKVKPFFEWQADAQA
jgi:phospholipid/cholesterol/gamma-HCH transport system ATP-binding protein